MLSFDEFIKLPFSIESQLLQMFDKNEKLVIFDVGSCECEDSIRYANLFKNSIVFSFEPVATNNSICKKNIEKYNLSKRIILFDYAVSDKISKEYIYLSEGRPVKFKDTEKDWNFGNKSSSLFKPDIITKVYPWLKFKKQQQVKTVYLDYFFETKKVSEIDILHINVSGSELSVLKGLCKNLDKVKVVYTTFACVKLYQNQPLKQEINKFLFNNNFELIMDRQGDCAGDEMLVNKKYL